MGYIWILWEYKYAVLFIHMQDLSLQVIGPGTHDNSSASLSAQGQTMEINLQALASANNGERDFIGKNDCVQHLYTEQPLH